ncbi:hypothetical protein JW911_01350 [Candidatus Peregrinibacteria bacterium]|nr:hypothetical protein [Candidatus Peregrinibacteria bacterium]
MFDENKNKVLIDKLKNLVKFAEFLPDSQRNDWIFMADSLSEKDLKTACRYFEKANTDLSNKKLEIVFKSGLSSEYLAQIKKLADDYRKQTTHKEEMHLQKTSENPEEVLKQLNDL